MSKSISHSDPVVDNMSKRQITGEQFTDNPARVHFAVAMLSAALLCVGCSRTSLVEVTGDVTLDDKPIETGLIGFWPTDGKGPSAAATITQGKYQALVSPGEKRVTVQAMVKTGEQRLSPSSPPVPNHKMISPQHYSNEKETDLRCEISPTEKLHSFRLKSS
jgi:hypothetical protein